MIGLAGLILLIFAVRWFLLSREGHRHWAVIASLLKELQCEADARNPERPVLRGKMATGDGWEDVQLGLKEIAALRSNDHLLRDYAHHRPNIDLQKVDALVNAHGNAVDHLRRGVMRGSVRFPFRWEDQSDLESGSKACGNLAMLAICKGRFLAQSGNLQESFELLLDTCMFARDLGYNSTTYVETQSMEVLEAALRDLRDLLLSGRLSRDQLLQIEHELQLIDGSFPRNVHAVLNGPIRMGLFLLKLDQREGGLSGLQRLHFAEAFEVTWEVMNQCKDLDDLPWLEAQVQYLRIERSRQEFADSRPSQEIQSPLWSDRMVREGRARLRLVRVAAHYLATGEVLDLGDPFGLQLQTRKSGNKLEIRSEGYARTSKLPAAETGIALEVER